MSGAIAGPCPFCDIPGLHMGAEDCIRALKNARVRDAKLLASAEANLRVVDEARDYLRRELTDAQAKLKERSYSVTLSIDEDALTETIAAIIKGGREKGWNI